MIKLNSSETNRALTKNYFFLPQRENSHHELLESILIRNQRYAETDLKPMSSIMNPIEMRQTDDPEKV